MGVCSPRLCTFRSVHVDILANATGSGLQNSKQEEVLGAGQWGQRMMRCTDGQLGHVCQARQRPGHPSVGSSVARSLTAQLVPSPVLSHTPDSQ